MKLFDTAARDRALKALSKKHPDARVWAAFNMWGRVITGVRYDLSAPQDQVNALEPQIAVLLDLLGHPEALVTDESTFLDFLSVFEYPKLADAQKELQRLLAPLGDVAKEIRAQDRLVAAARKLV